MNNRPAAVLRRATELHRQKVELIVNELLGAYAEQVAYTGGEEQLVAIDSYSFYLSRAALAELRALGWEVETVARHVETEKPTKISIRPAETEVTKHNSPGEVLARVFKDQSERVEEIVEAVVDDYVNKAAQQGELRHVLEIDYHNPLTECVLRRLRSLGWVVKLESNDELTDGPTRISMEPRVPDGLDIFVEILLGTMFVR